MSERSTGEPEDSSVNDLSADVFPITDLLYLVSCNVWRNPQSRTCKSAVRQQDCERGSRSVARSV